MKELKIANVTVIGLLLLLSALFLLGSGLVLFSANKSATPERLLLTKEQIFVIWKNGYLKGCKNSTYNDSIYKSDSLQLNKILYGNNF